MAETRMDHIKNQLKTIPTSPGVYVIRDVKGEVIYVGKAKNLINRLRSHFSPSNDFSKSRVIREIGHEIQVHVVKSENEALLLESSFIQEYQPRLNEHWKDGKTYPFLEVTLGERYPRFEVVRERNSETSAYLGPFSNVKALKRTLKYAFKLFPVADCAKEIHLGDADGWAHTCVRRRTRTCLRPCEVEQSNREYRQQVSHMMDFIEGRLPEIINELEKQMKVASKNQSYELAAKHRDSIRAIERTLERQQVRLPDVEDCYILSEARNKHDACTCLMKITNGRISRQETKIIDNDELKQSNNRLIWSEFVMNFLVHLLQLQSNKPDISKIIVDTRQSKTIMRQLTQFDFKPMLSEGTVELQLVQMNKQHAKRVLQQKLLLSQETSTPTLRVKDLQDILYMDAPPLNIDSFDVSTLLGKNNVASCVRFRNGTPFKSGYRRFRIKTVHQQDDFASMEEVVYRRYKSIKGGKDNRGLPQPDLIVIDGGSEQLKRAKKSLDSLSLDIMIVGLAKREEEIYQVDELEPLQLDKNRPGLLLLRAGRDEAHRFAVKYQRHLRQKEGLQSVLDEIEGIGPKRKKALLQRYKTVRNIAKESSETMSASLGISQKLASQVIETCRNYMTIINDSAIRRKQRSTKRE